MRPARVHCACWTALLVWIAAIPVGAQQVPLTGVVLDAATQSPIQGAVVTLGSAENAPVARTADNGTFVFARVDTGTYQLFVRRLGFEPARAVVQARDGARPVSIALRRIASLDTVQVRAARQGIFGIVAAWGEDMLPLPNATVQVLGGSLRQIVVDSTAHFFIPVQSAGTYVVRARAEGYAPRTLSLTLRAGEGKEIALLLDSASGQSTAALEHAYDEFRIRLARRGLASTLVPRTELGTEPRARLVDVIRSSPSFARKTLRFGDTVCLFINGRPRPGWSLNAMDPTAVEFVEVYAFGADASLTLQEQWPKGGECGVTGMPRAGRGRDVVQWVALWTR